VDVAALQRANLIEWTAGMCALVGVPTPPDAECLTLAEEAAMYITPRVNSAFPGAVEAIRRLHADGYELHTASGEPTAELHGYLTGMGVRGLFGSLYGPDLINTLKAGPAYYERIFADAGVAAGEALVVDDAPIAIEWAVSAGARAVLVGAREDAPSGVRAIPALADLPGIIGALADGRAG
jgi:beta-phosphoglucomutase-like phosphatase (HAD superfamily)